MKNTYKMRKLMKNDYILIPEVIRVVPEDSEGL